MRKIILIILLLLFSNNGIAEDWRFLLNRDGDNKPIEMDFHSVETEKDLIFLDIRFTPKLGWKSLLFNVAYHQEAIVVSCEKQSYAVATETDVLKDGSRKINSSTPLPSLAYITPNNGSEAYRTMQALCTTLLPNSQSKNQIQAPVKLNIKSKIIEKNPSEYNWRFVAEGVSDKHIVFIDTPSIKRMDENRIYVISKSEYQSNLKTTASNQYRYIVDDKIIDCKNETVFFGSMDFYSEDNQLVETYYLEPSELKSQKIPPSSLIFYIKNIACPIGLNQEIANNTGKSEEKAGSNISTGTGWLISSTNLVTAYHVIENATSIQVVTSEKDSIDAYVLATDASNDIAILRLNKPFKTIPLYLATKQPRLGSKVAVLGYPLPDVLGLKIQATSGEVSGLRGVGDDQRFFQISAPVQSGNSGGPLLNQEGEVIGIISSKLNDAEMIKSSGEVPQNVNFALKYPYVKALIESSGIEVKNILKKTNNIEDTINNAKNSVYLIIIERAKK